MSISKKVAIFRSLKSSRGREPNRQWNKPMSDVRKNPNHTLITCGDDWGSLGYAGSRRLKSDVR